MSFPGLYIHIPFCRKKCLYCDFFSAGLNFAKWDQYTLSLINELHLRKDEFDRKPDTIYIGGGTPSLMPLKNLEKLLSEIIKILSLQIEELSEITLEVNPEDVTRDNCLAWNDFGINRISIGVQSLCDIELNQIGRNHSSLTSISALDILSRYFENISVDLIYGLPGQNNENWRETLKTVMGFRPNHLSAYTLMLENKTPLTILHEKGKISLPSEEEVIKMWETLENLSCVAGYAPYEISNYALSGCESRHNNKYWKGYPYLGLGPSAHSYDGKNIRRSNPSKIKDYINFFGSSISPSNEKEDRISPHFYIEEILTEEEMREEMIMTRLRLMEGLNLKEFENKFGGSNKINLLRDSSSFIKKALLEEEDGHLRLTRQGVLISDDILSSII